MILYHFTAREYLTSILANGLWKGEVAVTRTDVLNAVWLTTDPNPAGHGLTDGAALTPREKEILGVPAHVPARFPNKRAIRIRVKLASADRNLVYWPRWGRKRLAPDWYETLSRTGGAKDKTWWLYWGTIPPSAFLEVKDLAEVATA